MERSPKIKVGIALVAGTGILLSSTGCSSPTQATWQKIRSKGLVTVLWDIHSQQLEVPKEEQLMVADSKVKGKLKSNSGVGAPRDTSDLKKAIVVPGKAGYVRTPYTSPPRLVDVRGFKPGTQVRCPYSREIFIVPKDAAVKSGISKLLSNLSIKDRSSSSEPTTASKKTPPTVPVKAPSKPSSSEKKQNLISKVTPRTTSPSAGSSQKIADNAGVGAGRSTATATKKSSAAPKPKKQASTPEPKKKLTADNKTKAPESKPKANEASSSKVADNKKPAAVNASPPFGVRVTGKPGFVYSPYAAKHQLVNVEGLTPGIAVRCPYSGKIFRVPDEVSQAAAAPEVEVPAPPTKTIAGPNEADVPAGPADSAAVGSPKKRGTNKNKAKSKASE